MATKANNKEGISTKSIKFHKRINDLEDEVKSCKERLDGFDNKFKTLLDEVQVISGWIKWNFDVDLGNEEIEVEEGNAPQDHEETSNLPQKSIPTPTPRATRVNLRQCNKRREQESETQDVSGHVVKRLRHSLPPISGISKPSSDGAENKIQVEKKKDETTSVSTTVTVTAPKPKVRKRKRPKFLLTTRRRAPGRSRVNKPIDPPAGTLPPLIDLKSTSVGKQRSKPLSRIETYASITVSPPKKPRQPNKARKDLPKIISKAPKILLQLSTSNNLNSSKLETQEQKDEPTTEEPLPAPPIVIPPLGNKKSGKPRGRPKKSEPAKPTSNTIEAQLPSANLKPDKIETPANPIAAPISEISSLKASGSGNQSVQLKKPPAPEVVPLPLLKPNSNRESAKIRSELPPDVKPIKVFKFNTESKPGEKRLQSIIITPAATPASAPSIKFASGEVRAPGNPLPKPKYKTKVVQPTVMLPQSLLPSPPPRPSILNRPQKAPPTINTGKSMFLTKPKSPKPNNQDIKDQAEKFDYQHLIGNAFDLEETEEFDQVLEEDAPTLHDPLELSSSRRKQILTSRVFCPIEVVSLKSKPQVERDPLEIVTLPLPSTSTTKQGNTIVGVGIGNVEKKIKLELRALDSSDSKAGVGIKKVVDPLLLPAVPAFKPKITSNNNNLKKKCTWPSCNLWFQDDFALETHIRSHGQAPPSLIREIGEGASFL